MVRVEFAADYPDLIPTIARWHWDAWGHADPQGSLRAWTYGLYRRINRDRIPMTLLALADEGTPLGSVTLVDHDMPDRTDLAHLTPWIAGTFVAPSKRGQGAGTALMNRATEEASHLGVRELFLYTSTAQPFYQRLGWTPVRDDSYEGESVTIMRLDIANPS